MLDYTCTIYRTVHKRFAVCISVCHALSEEQRPCQGKSWQPPIPGLPEHGRRAYFILPTLSDCTLLPETPALPPEGHQTRRGFRFWIDGGCPRPGLCHRKRRDSVFQPNPSKLGKEKMSRFRNSSAFRLGKLWMETWGEGALRVSHPAPICEREASHQKLKGGWAGKVA